MKTSTLMLGLALCLSACADDNPKLRTYDNNDLELAVGFAAKMTCTCRFVMEQDEAYCKEWVRASPNVARFSIDFEKKVVNASAFISWTARAHYVDDQHGCVLE